MIFNIKKKLQNFFKYLAYKMFSLAHGKIKGVLSADNKQVQVNKILISENLYKIYTLQSARVYTDTINDTAFIIDNYLVGGPSFQIRNVKNDRIEKNIILNKGTPRIQKKLKGSVLSLLTGGAGNSNYFHWLFDVLPRFEILSKLKNIKNIDYFLLPSLDEKFQNETLNILEIPLNKRISSKLCRHVRADQILSTDHPYVTGSATIQIQNIPIWIIEWLKKSFISQIDKNISSMPKNFYIDRKDSKSNHNYLRKIINENEVKTILNQYNFKTVTLSKLSFIEQVQLFNKAENIVGLHGAGFANLVFCKKNTNVLEIRTNTTGLVIENLANNNHLNFKDITLKPDSNDFNNQLGHIHVPIEILKKKLNYMLNNKAY
jgi:hypothetical protein